MALTGSTSRAALEGGPARVYFDEVSLGYLGEGLVLNINTDEFPLHGGEAGTADLDNIVSGGGLSLEVPLAELSLSNIARGIVNSTFSGGVLTFLNRTGLSILSTAKKLDIIKIRGGQLSPNPEDHFVFPSAAPAGSEVKYTFHPSEQRFVVITFKIYQEDGTGIWGTVGV